MAPRKIIIDTDPGVDDIIAILLALSAEEEELEVLLISLTFGNIELEHCLRNVVSLFHILEEDRKWRLENNLPTGFHSLAKFKPIVSLGADGPLEDQKIIADYYHGFDGLGNVHTTAPHFTPTETWQHLFQTTPSLKHSGGHPPNFIPTATKSHHQILDLLRTHPPDTITIVALGPLSNLSLAAEEDPETFLRAAEVVVMGGAIDVVGNVTPTAEFNHFACAWSAARIYALTSPNPTSTLPVSPSGRFTPYPATLSRKLNLTIVPLDITSQHLLSRAEFDAAAATLIAKGSPLARWMDVFLAATFAALGEMYKGVTIPCGEGEKHQSRDFALHDPLCVWYLLSLHRGEVWKAVENKDIRIETTGQWTRGTCIVDKRGRYVEENLAKSPKVADTGLWCHKGYGNRVRQLVSSPEGHPLGVAKEFLRRVFVAEEEPLKVVLP